MQKVTPFPAIDGPSASPGLERQPMPAMFSDSEVLKLSANCCYNGCIGCTSVKKLRDFRGRWPTDWMHRLSGSARLRTEALRVT
jgi:hypothetical protein